VPPACLARACSPRALARHRWRGVSLLRPGRCAPGPSL